MQIIGAGLGRTGTSSLKVALEMLGVAPCYHMNVLNNHPDHVDFWLDVVAGCSVDWTGFFAPYAATLDWPACDYYAELMQAYPQAKIILTVRDCEKWYDSMYETIYSYNKNFPGWAKAVAPQAARLVELRQLQVWQAKFNERFEDRQYAIEVFKAHNEAVKRVVPAQHLLVYEVHQGWEPLCHFLQLPVPAEPFPHVNDREQFQRFGKWASAKKKTG